MATNPTDPRERLVKAYAALEAEQARIAAAQSSLPNILLKNIELSNKGRYKTETDLDKYLAASTKELNQRGQPRPWAYCSTAVCEAYRAAGFTLPDGRRWPIVPGNQSFQKQATGFGLQQVKPDKRGKYELKPGDILQWKEGNVPTHMTVVGADGKQYYSPGDRTDFTSDEINPEDVKNYNVWRYVGNTPTIEKEIEKLVKEAKTLPRDSAVQPIPTLQPKPVKQQYGYRPVFAPKFESDKVPKYQYAGQPTDAQTAQDPQKEELGIKTPNEISTWNRDWITDPTTVQRFNQQAAPYTNNPGQIRSEALRYLDGVPVIDREYANQQGLKAEDYNSYKSPIHPNEGPYNSLYYRPEFGDLAGPMVARKYDNAGRYSEAPIYNRSAIQAPIAGMRTFMDSTDMSNIYNRGMAAHEWTHVTEPYQNIMESVIVNKYPSEKWGPWAGSTPPEGTSQERYDYLKKDGMYPRIQGMRSIMGVQPGQPITKDQLYQFRDSPDENTNKIFKLQYDDLRRFYDDDTIVKMLNELAVNDASNSMQSGAAFTAAFGGVPKYQKGPEPKEETLGPYTLPEMTVVGANTRAGEGTLAMLNNMAKSYELTRDEMENMLRLWAQYGTPYIHPIPKPNYKDTYRAFYTADPEYARIFTQPRYTVGGTKEPAEDKFDQYAVAHQRDLVAELAHAKQFVEQYKSDVEAFNAAARRDIQKNIDAGYDPDEAQLQTYGQPNTLENQAHYIIEPSLWDYIFSPSIGPTVKLDYLPYHQYRLPRKEANGGVPKYQTGTQPGRALTEQERQDWQNSLVDWVRTEYGGDFQAAANDLKQNPWKSPYADQAVEVLDWAQTVGSGKITPNDHPLAGLVAQGIEPVMGMMAGEGVDDLAKVISRLPNMLDSKPFTDTAGETVQDAIEWGKRWYSHPKFVDRVTDNQDPETLKFLYNWIGKNEHDSVYKKLQSYSKQKQEDILSDIDETKIKDFKQLLKEDGLLPNIYTYFKALGSTNSTPQGVYIRNNERPFSKSWFKGLLSGSGVKMPNKKRQSIITHEVMGHVSDKGGDRFNPSEIASLQKPTVDAPLKKGRSAKRNFDYYTEPTEVRARMQQARHKLNLTPEDNFTPEMFDFIQDQTDWFGMGKYIKDKDEFVKLMNKMWAVPAAGAAVNEAVGAGEVPKQQKGTLPTQAQLDSAAQVTANNLGDALNASYSTMAERRRQELKDYYDNTLVPYYINEGLGVQEAKDEANKYLYSSHPETFFELFPEAQAEQDLGPLQSLYGPILDKYMPSTEMGTGLNYYDFSEAHLTPEGMMKLPFDVLEAAKATRGEYGDPLEQDLVSLYTKGRTAYRTLRPTITPEGTKAFGLAPELEPDIEEEALSALLPEDPTAEVKWRQNPFNPYQYFIKTEFTPFGDYRLVYDTRDNTYSYRDRYDLDQVPMVDRVFQPYDIYGKFKARTPILPLVTVMPEKKQTGTVPMSGTMPYTETQWPGIPGILPTVAVTEDMVPKQRISDAQMAFLAERYEMLRKAAEERGLANPHVIAALAASMNALESGYNPNKRSPFGVKWHKGAHPDDNKFDKELLWTTEYENGKKVRRQSYFRKYKTQQEAAGDFLDFMINNPGDRYKDFLNSKTLLDAVNAIDASGYSTSPKYGKTLKGILQYMLGPDIFEQVTTPRA